MLIQRNKSLSVLMAVAVWLVLKTVNLTNGNKLDTFCQQYLVRGQILHDCVACLKFGESQEWVNVKDLQISIAGDEQKGDAEDEFQGMIIQQSQCIQYECSSLLGEDFWFEREDSKKILAANDMQLTGERTNKIGSVSTFYLFRRSPNVSGIAVRYRLMSKRTQTHVVVHHPQESILSKAFIAFIGLAIGTLEIPYLLVFLPRLDVLVQSAMVFNSLKGLNVPCKRMLSFALALSYGCLYTFHTKLPDVWLRFNIALVLILALLSRGKYVVTTIAMIAVAVQLYRIYLDTEAIWATIVVAFYFIRIEAESDHGGVPLSYDFVPQITIEDATV